MGSLTINTLLTLSKICFRCFVWILILFFESVFYMRHNRSFIFIGLLLIHTCGVYGDAKPQTIQIFYIVFNNSIDSVCWFYHLSRVSENLPEAKTWSNSVVFSSIVLTWLWNLNIFFFRAKSCVCAKTKIKNKHPMYQWH